MPNDPLLSSSRSFISSTSADPIQASHEQALSIVQQIYARVPDWRGHDIWTDFGLLLFYGGFKVLRPAKEKELDRPYYVVVFQRVILLLKEITPEFRNVQRGLKIKGVIDLAGVREVECISEQGYPHVLLIVHSTESASVNVSHHKPSFLGKKVTLTSPHRDNALTVDNGVREELKLVCSSESEMLTWQDSLRRAIDAHIRRNNNGGDTSAGMQYETHSSTASTVNAHLLSRDQARHSLSLSSAPSNVPTEQDSATDVKAY